jgi:hypothetical protein
LQHAEEIFLAAQAGGPEDCDLAILVKDDGGIHVVAGPEGELEPLRIHHGAAAAYRLRRDVAGVRLEARSRRQSCRFETNDAARPIWPALPDYPQYRLVS